MLCVVVTIARFIGALSLQDETMSRNRFIIIFPNIEIDFCECLIGGSVPEAQRAGFSMKSSRDNKCFVVLGSAVQAEIKDGGERGVVQENYEFF